MIAGHLFSSNLYSNISNIINIDDENNNNNQKTKQSTLYLQHKHAIRLLIFKDQFMHSRSLLKEISALNIYEINIFNILYLMFKCKNKACPKPFENLFTLKPKNEYQLKRSCALLEPFCKSRFRQVYINYLGPHLWNTIVLSHNAELEHPQQYNFLKKNLWLIFSLLTMLYFILILCYIRR